MKPIKYILFVLLICAVISVIMPYVKADLGTFRQGDCVSLRVLSNCSSVNLTEVSSNNYTYVINQQMTRLGGQTYNYTFCNTSAIDTYTYSWFPSCQDCATQVNCGNSFSVTPTGNILSSATSNILITGEIIILLICILLFVFGMFARGIGIKIFFLSFSILLAIFLIGTTLAIMNNSLGDNSPFSSSYGKFYIMIIGIAGGLGSGLILWLVWFAFTEFKKTRGWEGKQ
jgi:hypothetical protein